MEKERKRERRRKRKGRVPVRLPNRESWQYDESDKMFTFHLRKRATEENDGEEGEAIVVTARYAIFAGGRFFPMLMAKEEKCPMSFMRVEVGLRIEDSSDNPFFTEIGIPPSTLAAVIRTPLIDPIPQNRGLGPEIQVRGGQQRRGSSTNRVANVLLLPVRRPIFRVVVPLLLSSSLRRQGEVVQTESFGIATWSGRADCPPPRCLPLSLASLSLTGPHASLSSPLRC